MTESKNKKTKKRKWWLIPASMMTVSLVFFIVAAPNLLWNLFANTFSANKSNYGTSADFQKNLVISKKQATEVAEWNYKDLKSVAFKDDDVRKYDYQISDSWMSSSLAVGGYINGDNDKNFTVGLTDDGEIGDSDIEDLTQIYLNYEKSLKRPGADFGEIHIQPLTLNYYDIQELKKQGFSKNITAENIRNYKMKVVFSEQNPDIVNQKVKTIEDQVEEIIRWNCKNIDQIDFLDGENIELVGNGDSFGAIVYEAASIHGYLNGKTDEDFIVNISRDLGLMEIDFNFSQGNQFKKNPSAGDYKPTERNYLTYDDIQYLKTQGYDENITAEEIQNLKMVASFIDQDQNVINANIENAYKQAEEILKWNLEDVNGLDFSHTEENKYYGGQNGGELYARINDDSHRDVMVTINGDYSIGQIRLMNLTKQSIKIDDRFTEIRSYGNWHGEKYLTYDDIQYLKTQGYDENITAEEIEKYKEEQQKQSD